jgi:branched-chain amino acid transport system ATP-binding protein
VSEPLLAVDGLSRSFGKLVVLAGLDLTVEAGGVHAIIGPNGAGKTTFFNLVTGTLEPDGGRIRFGGRDIGHLPPYRRTALGICRTFQNIRLFANMTAIENVLVGMNSRIALGLWDVLSHSPGFRRTETALAARALALLERVGLQASANDVARNLPYGDRRRLELARALASEPALLLLDEPTAGMTQGEAGALMRLLRGLVADLGLAIVLIEHNMRVVMEVSDWVTVLDHGERIAEGSPREVQENPRVVEAYLGTRSPGRRRA